MNNDRQREIKLLTQKMKFQFENKLITTFSDQLVANFDLMRLSALTLMESYEAIRKARKALKERELKKDSLITTVGPFFNK